MARYHSSVQKPSNRLRLDFTSLLAWLLLAAVVCAVGSLGHAARLPDPGLESGLRPMFAKRGDLILRNASLADALLAISENWSVNVVAGQEVDGTVNCAFRNAPLQEILDSILVANGFSYRPVGKSLVVQRLEASGDVNPLFATATIAIPTGDPQEIVEGAKLLNSPRGKVKAFASTRSLLVVDYPDRIAMIRGFVQNLHHSGSDTESTPAGPPAIEVGYFMTHHIPALSAKEAIASVLSDEGRISVLEDEDQLVVVDYPQNQALAGQVIKQLDIPRKVIRITSYIYDVSLEDMETLGVNWSHSLQGRPDAAGSTAQWDIDALTLVPFNPAAAGGVMTFANMSEVFDLEAAIQALETAKDSRLLADPNVTVIENERASVAIIQEIPFQQLTETAGGGNIGTTAFREAGVKLSVTARAAGQDTVWMQVEPEFSRLAGFTPEDNQPIIDRRTASTTVRVRNQHTLVIGGLRQRTDVGTFNGIPFLQDLPLGVGLLFRGRETTVRESELLVFIRPEIVTVDHPPSCREDAAIQTGRHFLGKIPQGEIHGHGVPHEVIYETVPALESTEAAPIGKPAIGAPLPTPDDAAGVRRIGPRNQRLARIPAVPGHVYPVRQTSLRQTDLTPSNAGATRPLSILNDRPVRLPTIQTPADKASRTKPAKPSRSSWLHRLFPPQS